MKRIFFIFSIIVLLAAGCNPKNQPPSQSAGTSNNNVLTNQQQKQQLLPGVQFKNLPADVFPERINATSSVDGILYAFSIQPNATFDQSAEPEINGKSVVWHGVLRSLDNGQVWTKFFTISDNSGLGYEPVAVFSENNKIYVDIVNSNGAGSGEGQLIRFSTIDDGKTWQRNQCYYFIPESYYYFNGSINKVNPHNLKQIQGCVY